MHLNYLSAAWCSQSCSFAKWDKGGISCTILHPSTAKCWSAGIASISSTWSSSVGSPGKRRVPWGAQVLLITWVLKQFGFLVGFCVLGFWLFFLLIFEWGLIWTSCSSVHLPWEGWDSLESLVWAWSNAPLLYCLVRNSSAEPRAVIPW